MGFFYPQFIPIPRGTGNGIQCQINQQLFRLEQVIKKVAAIKYDWLSLFVQAPQQPLPAPAAT